MRPRPRRSLVVSLSLVLATLARSRASACDVCAVYMATEQREGQTGFHLGVAEQYTHFGTELQDGAEVTLPADERMDSAITQFFLGYRFTPRIGLQLVVPYVVRSFRRIHDHRIQTGTENGIGDLSLLGTFRVLSLVTDRSTLQVGVVAGVKFPSGDPSRLGEELDTAAPAASPRHATHEAPAANGLPAEGGLHGHDLALGSGSYDGIVGGQLFWSRDRLFATAGGQYAVRSTGAFDYRYANDLTWVGGPGWFALLTHEYTLGVQLLVSGETKGKDTQQGVKADDTAMTALYLGPGFSVTWGTSLAADLAVDVPVLQHDTALQLVPDVRLRGGLTWRF